ncbi:MAG: hypothetical protein WD342_07320 [Verrucomicrobiales bacterium]
MNIDLRIFVDDSAGTEDLVWLGGQLERWADFMLDEGCECHIASDALADLKNGEFPKSGRLQIPGMIEVFSKMSSILKREPLQMTPHQREQLEAEMDSAAPRGSIFIVVDVSDDMELRDVDAAGELERFLGEKPGLVRVERQTTRLQEFVSESSTSPVLLPPHQIRQLLPELPLSG